METDALYIDIGCVTSEAVPWRVFAAWWACNAGGEDAGGCGDCIRYLLAAVACVHPAHRLQTWPHRVRDHLAEKLLRRRLFGRALAGDEQQLRQPVHLRLPARLFPGIVNILSAFDLLEIAEIFFDLIG